MIRYTLKTTYCRKKSYVDNRRRGLEFEVGYMVYLKIPPMKGVKRLCKKGKLIPRYVGPYEIVKWSGKVAYQVN